MMTNTILDHTSPNARLNAYEPIMTERFHRVAMSAMLFLLAISIYALGTGAERFGFAPYGNWIIHAAVAAVLGTSFATFVLTYSQENLFRPKTILPTNRKGDEKGGRGASESRIRIDDSVLGVQRFWMGWDATWEGGLTIIRQWHERLRELELGRRFP